MAAKRIMAGETATRISSVTRRTYRPAMPRPKQRRAISSEPETEPLRKIHIPEAPLPASTPAPIHSKHLELTQVVKEAAKAALDAIAKVDFEDLAHTGISRLLLRCIDEGAAEAMRNRLGIPPSGRARAKDSGPQPPDRSVTIDLHRFLPQTFNDLLGDVAEGDFASLPVPNKLVTDLQQFVATFREGWVVRILLDDPREVPDTDLEPNRRCVFAAHKALVSAGQRMLEVISDSPIHQVRIESAANPMKPLSFTIDGGSVELLPRPQRALCALALLMPKGPVDIKEFMRLYSGDDNDARRDLHTIFTVLKEWLPRMAWKAAKGIRRMSGIQIRTDASAAQLTKFLEEHRKAPK